VTPGLIGWDPQCSLLAGRSDDEAYLQKGFSTLIETVTYDELLSNRPAPGKWPAARRLNWGFLVSGEPAQESQDKPLLVADWFAAGSRAWVFADDAHVSAEAKRIPSWFGVDLIPPSVAARFQVPYSLEGEPGTVLSRWTSEAAQQLHITRRGVIAPGAIADLVIWTSSPGHSPSELRDFKPSRVIINGQLDSNPHGRFLGR
jgi:hypothetical protein